MKKTLIVTALVVTALAIAATAVFAQGSQPAATPFAPGYGMMGGRGGHGPMMGAGETGPMHDYIEAALAEKLGLTETQIEEALATGTTMYQLVLDNGVAEADVPTFLNEVHAAAFEKAVADGVMTQEQADWMSQRMAQRGYGYGEADGTCPMGGTAPADGTGVQYGRGMHGGRWQQQTNP